jgi:hypothetical protein
MSNQKPMYSGSSEPEPQRWGVGRSHQITISVTEQGCGALSFEVEDTATVL